jgi:hypothetical protein
LQQTDFKSFALRAAFVSQKNRADEKTNCTGIVQTGAER